MLIFPELRMQIPIYYKALIREKENRSYTIRQHGCANIMTDIKKMIENVYRRILCDVLKWHELDSSNYRFVTVHECLICPW